MKKLIRLLSALVWLPSSLAATQFNVVLILADDLGWADTTLNGQTKFYQTPNLERLAKRGMTFDRAYSASPLCSPTRAAILTGLSPARTGITAPNCHLPKVILAATPGTGNPNAKSTTPESVSRLKTSYHTIPKSLKTAGYVTGHFGKWHLGPAPYSPREHDFDVDIPHWPGPGPAGSFVAPWKFKDFDHDPTIPDEHLEDRMAKEAVSFLEKHRNDPFFLNYWMFSVHAPFDAKKTLVEKYEKLVNPANPQRSPTYAAMIESMDDAVGTLLDTLDRLKLSEKTLIIFASDNGGNMYNRIDDTTPTSNAPLRGGKATLFEGGVRTPLIISWPGIAQAGTRSNTLVQSEDFYPTLLDGLSLPIAKGQKFDGISIIPALKGGNLKRESIFNYFPHAPGVPDWLPPSVSVIQNDWKLIRIFFGGENGAHRWKLYNLKSDIGEKTDLANQEPQRVKEMDELIANFLKTTDTVTPIRNPAFNPEIYHIEDEGIQKTKAVGKTPNKTKK